MDEFLEVCEETGKLTELFEVKRDLLTADLLLLEAFAACQVGVMSNDLTKRIMKFVELGKSR